MPEVPESAGASTPPAPPSSVLVPYAAYLRVYEPLAAFPEPERARWRRYAERTERPSYQDELRRSLAALASTPPVPVPVHESDDAFVAEVAGVLYVCPWRTRLRGWLALGRLAGELPRQVLDAALPPVLRQQTADDYERWLGEHPDARPWIRSAAWQVPLTWFVLVGDEERDHRPATEDEKGEPVPAVLRYRTPMVQARRRVARALRTFRDTLEDSSVEEDMVDIGRWLEEFHPRSLVELDYGGLVHALPQERLEDDRSAKEVAEAVAALRRGDADTAREVYERLSARWREVRARGSAS